MAPKGRKRKTKADDEAAAAAADAPAAGAAGAAAADAAEAKAPKARGGRSKKAKATADADAATAAADTKADAKADAAAADAKADAKPAAAAAAAAADVPDPDPPKVAEYNEVLCFGSGDMSQLGLGAGTLERKNPAPLKALEGHNVVAIASGALHNAVLTEGGHVWTWGCNDDQALGRDADEWLPARVTSLSKKGVRIASVTAGDCHTLALDTTGRVWSWGTYKDNNGIMGFDEKTERAALPVLVAGPLSKRGVVVTQIASGEHHDLALTDKGEVFEWGDTRVGARGSARIKRTKLVPQRVTFKLKGGKAVKIARVWACGMSNFAKSTDGHVFAWGLNNYGQCGVNSRDNVLVPAVVPTFAGVDIVEIAGGQHHALGLAKDGTVYSWGRCHYGRLGQGGPTGADGKWADADDRLVPTPIAPLNASADKVATIAAGEGHSMAVTRAGVLYSWGFNELCQLGLGHDNEVNVPQRCNGQQLTVTAIRKVLAASAGSQHSIILARKDFSKAAPAAAAAASAAAAAPAAAAAGAPAAK